MPRHRIPKLLAICPKCQSPVRTIQGVPFAEGYHRRHYCKASGCGYAFYTIKPYDDRPAKSSPLPFRDRELTDIEHDERMRWWTEMVPSQVTPQGNDPFMDYLSSALNKAEEHRDSMESYAVRMFTALKQKVEAAVALPNQEGE